MTTTIAKTTITVQGTCYPIIRLTARKSLDVCGMHICKGEIFFLVRSRKGSQEYMPVRWNYERKCWQCSCEMGCKMHKHVALCSKFSQVHPYSQSHPNGCPPVVKEEQPVPPSTQVVEAAPILPEVVDAAPKITEVEAGAWYIVGGQQVWFGDGQWHCSCGEFCSGHISDVKAFLQKAESDRELRELALEAEVAAAEAPSKAQQHYNTRERRAAKNQTHLYLVADECCEIKKRRAATAV
jgi:hypothetical protein